MDTCIIRHITYAVVVLVSQPSGRIGLSKNVFSTINYSVIEHLPFIFRRNALDYGIGHHGCGIIAHHTSPVTRAGPFRQEVALYGYVRESLLNLPGS